jgi:hypothetical protein
MICHLEPFDDLLRANSARDLELTDPLSDFSLPCSCCLEGTAQSPRMFVLAHHFPPARDLRGNKLLQSGVPYAWVAH